MSWFSGLFAAICGSEFYFYKLAWTLSVCILSLSVAIETSLTSLKDRYNHYEGDHFAAEGKMIGKPVGLMGGLWKLLEKGE